MHISPRDAYADGRVVGEFSFFSEIVGSNPPLGMFFFFSSFTGS